MPHCISPELLRVWAVASLRDHQASMMSVRSSLRLVSGTGTQRLGQCPANSPVIRSSNVTGVFQHT